MKKYLLGVVFILVLSVFSFMPAAHAVNFVSLVTFPINTAATDTQSGNAIDYVYAHDLSELNAAGITFNSAALELKHSGNQNLGPTAEIWFGFSGNGTFIGQLGESESGARTDQWILNLAIWNEITVQNPWKLNVGLSERTSFNSEKINLFQSKLTIDYTVNDLPAPPNPIATPEPSSLILIAIGLLSVIKQKFLREFLFRG